MAVSGKAGSCLPLVGSLQYRTLANSMYWFPLPFQLPVVIWPVQCWKRRKTPNKQISYSFPLFLYMWSIYMQPKYVTQSQFWLPFVLYDEAHHLLPHPSPLLHTSLTITQDLQPHWVLCFSFDITKYLCLFSVTQYCWRSQRWVGDVGWDYSINGKQTIWYISKG